MLSRLVRSAKPYKIPNPFTSSKVSVDIKVTSSRINQSSVSSNTIQSSSSEVSDSMKPYYMTTPIFYVNGEPHIGHMFSVLLADISCRWRTINGEQAVFMAGTDEHGIKVKEASEKAGFSSPKAFCDDISSQFREAWSALNIAYGGFYRTTDPGHRETVYKLWETLLERGYIYEGEYSGWYCKSDEAFVTEKSLIRQADGTFRTESGHPVEWVSERTFKFALSKFAKPLREWLQNSPGAITPPSRLAETLAMIDSGLDDLSISRPMSRVQWGLPVPGFPEDAIYVWLDALAIYLTAAKDISTRLGLSVVQEEIANALNGAPLWPADVQVIGKDIVRFHCIFWPAFLLASGLPLPSRVHAHGHWQVEGVKMSKSLGNVLSPRDLVAKYGVDNSRYGLIRLGSVADDMSFSSSELVNQLNAELANNIGNLAVRVTSLALLPNQTYPDPLGKFRRTDGTWDEARITAEGLFTEADLALQEKLNSLYKEVDPLFRSMRPDDALRTINQLTSFVNVYVTREEPWKLKAKKGEAEDPKMSARREVSRL